MKKIQFSIVATLVVLGVAAVPALSMAATYAYVNTTGEVMTMEAATAAQALLTAPNLHVHSGVMLIDDSADNELKGDQVPGA